MRFTGTHSGLIATLVCMGALYFSGLGSHGMLMWDEAHYAVLGRALARGEGYTRPDGTPEALRPPALPTAVAAVLLVSPNAPDKTILRITVVAALLCVIVIYAFVFREAGMIAATSASVLFATSPEIWRSTSYLLSEIPFMLFYTPAVLFFYRGMYVDSRSFTTSWLCFALALLTRYTAVLFGPTLLLLVCVPLILRDRDAIERMLSPHFFLGPVLAAIVVAPLFVRSYTLFGDPLVGFRAAARQLPNYSRHATMPTSHYLTLLPVMLGWLAALALPAAIGQALARRHRLGICCTIAASVIVAWLSQYGWKEPRLVSAAIPFLTIAIGLGVDDVWSHFRERSGAPSATTAQTWGAVAASFLFVASIRVDPSYARARQEILLSTTLGYPSFLLATHEIIRDTPGSTVLMGPNCHQLSWYTDRACHQHPPIEDLRGPDPDLADSLTGIDFVVVTSFERGQPKYVAKELERAEQIDASRVRTFRDRRFWTKIVPADLLRTKRSDTEASVH